MRKTLIAILVCFTMLGFSAQYASAQYASAPQSGIAENVVINEVEIGNGLENDWVELYNPTVTHVEIGGWRISSFLQGGMSFIIPSGEIIKPGEFLVYEYEPTWFLAQSSIVQLHNTQGDLVDYSTLIGDSKADSQTWFREVDGFTSISSDNWKFGNSTRAMPNVAYVETKTIDLSTDSESYVFGQTILIRGTVPEFAPDPYIPSIPASLTLEILHPAKKQTLVLYPDRDLQFGYDLTLQPSQGFALGSYTVNAMYSEWNSTVSFDVIVPEIVQDTKITEFIVATTDKDIYNPGQTVTLSGATNIQQDYAILTYYITAPNGDLVKSGTVFPSSDGKFLTEFYLPLLDLESGTYKTELKYVDRHIDLTFEIIGVNDATNPLEVYFDKDAYGLNDTVKISGSVNDVVDIAVDIIIEQVSTTSDSITGHLDKISHSVRTTDVKNFEYDYIVYDNADRYGKYKVTVESETNNKILYFVVTPNPQEYKKNILPLTVESDRTVYNIGEAISFSGRVDVRGEDVLQALVSITMTDPGGDVLTTANAKAGSDKVTEHVQYTLTAVPDAGGAYSVDGTLFPSLFAAGIYEAMAVYADGLHSKTITFTVLDPLNDAPIALYLDKESYGANQDVVVRADAPGLTQGNLVDVVLYMPSGTKESTRIVSDESEFVWSWTTPKVLHSENQGKYIVEFDSIIGSNQIEFTVGDSRYTNPIIFAVDGDLITGGNLQVDGIIKESDSDHVNVRIYKQSDDPNILYATDEKINDGTFSFKVPIPDSLWDKGYYLMEISTSEYTVTESFVLEQGSITQIRHTEKFTNLRQTSLSISFDTIDDDEQVLHPRTIQGALIAGPFGSGNDADLSLSTSEGTCIVGSAESCLVNEITKITSSGPYVTVMADGESYKVRYSGSDANIEQFTVLPTNAGQVFDDSDWSLNIDDSGLPTKFNYKITYVP